VIELQKNDKRNGPLPAEGTKECVLSAWDLIGDIHGHAEELRTLLGMLGYVRVHGHYRHPEGRRVIFLGDYVDRGPRIREVLEIVRGMVEADSAQAILGNHEINAMRFHAIGKSGKPLLSHTPAKIRQLQATPDQFPDLDEKREWLRWFSGLPLFVERDGLRAIHACWDEEAVAHLREIGPLEGETLEIHSLRGNREQALLRRIISGPEGMLPSGVRNETFDGTMRREFRVRWWDDLRGVTCRNAIFPYDERVPDVAPHSMPDTGYADAAPPVFFGHYALKDARPGPIRGNLACLDYGMGKGGSLVAYRWDGERVLDAGKFLAVETLVREKALALE